MAASPRKTGTGPLAGINLQGFNFSYRNGVFDWRLLHGIDVEAVVRLTDVKAVEDSLHTLRHGSLGGEKGLSVKNCIQLFRLLQLSVEYLTHLRNAHVVLLERYEEATLAAERWKMSARHYMDLGSLFLEESMQHASICRQRLDQVDDSRVNLEAQDQQYNDTLDNLEHEDQRARYFHFRKQRAELNWQQIYSIELEELTANVDVPTLDAVLHNLVYGSIVTEDREELTPHHFGHLIPLAQCALDYMLFQANATGAMLEATMAQLQSCCGEIPPLTTASQEMHRQITTLIMEAHDAASLPSFSPGGQQMYPGGGGGSGMMQPTSAGGPAGLLPGGALRNSTTSFARTGAGYNSATTGTGMGAEAFLTAPGFSRSPTKAVGASTMFGSPAGSKPYGSTTAMPQYISSPGGQQQYTDPGAGQESMLYSTAERRFYDEMLIGAMASASAGGGAAAGAAAAKAFEVHAHASELHYKVDALESDLRMERYKTDEMRRLIGDIRERLSCPVGADGGGGDAAMDGFGSRTRSGQQGFSKDWQGNPVMMSRDGQGFRMSQGSEVAFRVTSSRAASPFESASAMAPALATRSPTKVRVIVDEDFIRAQERQKAVNMMAQQVESMKAQVLKQHSKDLKKFGRISSGGNANPSAGGSRGPSPLRKGSSGVRVSGSGAAGEGRSAAAAAGTAESLQRFIQERMSKQVDDGVSGKAGHRRTNSASTAIAFQELQKKIMQERDIPDTSRVTVSMTENKGALKGNDPAQLPDAALLLPPPRKFNDDKPPLPSSGGLGPSRSSRTGSQPTRMSVVSS